MRDEPSVLLSPTTLLGELHDWMARENATIMAVICLIIGAQLFGDAISALTT